MAQPVIQHSFHAGEWAPALNARVDLQKYHAGAALLRNFFVDYRGGASSRPGTKYILQCLKSGSIVRLIPFQASATVGYILEFGDKYVRFINNGSVVLEPSINVTGVSGNTITATNTYNAGDWVFLTGVGGITNINGKYFIVATATGANFTVTDLRGGAVTFTGAYTSGGTAARVYTLPSPYAAADLAKVKFTQTASAMILCHTSYVPYILTLISPANWTLVPIVFGSSLPAPSGVAAATSNAGPWNVSYQVTAVDAQGQESPVSATVSSTVNNTSGASATITVSWNTVSGAESYNIYRSMISSAAVPPTGADFGYIANVTGLSNADAFIGGQSIIATDFSIAPPIVRSPFSGAPVASISADSPGSYTAVPNVTVAAAPPGFNTATAIAVLGVIGVTINNGGSGYNRLIDPTLVGPDGSTFHIVNTSGGAVTQVLISNTGSLSSGSTPANPVSTTNNVGSGCTLNLTWGVVIVTVTSGGSGYLTAPAVTFSAGTATATAHLGATTSSNPGVPGLFQQRLVLAAKSTSPQTFDMSQTGYLYNYNTSNPVQADDAIEGSIVSGQLNEIKSMLSVPTGLMMLTSKANWLINGGATGEAVTPANVTANAHSYNGASDVPPIVANFDILFVQEKGSIVRDLAFNFYTQIYTGTDISVLSSHLFYGFTINEWAWAEEPYKIVWAVRNDGIMLSLTFLKEQELIGWSHSDTQGLFKSVATVTEPVSIGLVDAVYTVVQRTVGGQTLQYIERFAERFFNGQAVNSWCVDAGLQYNGAPATSFSGADHLAGLSVTGLADGKVIPAFTVAANGTFTLSAPASVVTVGLAYTPDLQTLALDTGEPTIQGKMKTIPRVTVRVAETLGLSIGKTFSTLVPMKDLTLGNVGSMSNQVVTDLVTADARTILDPSWTVPGQYCIRQPYPLPASILGVIPEVSVGDTPK